MDVRSIFNTESDRASQRYDLLVSGWRTLYRNAINASNFGSEQQRRAVMTEAFNLARSYLATEEVEIAAALSQIATEAQGATRAQLAVSVAPELSEQALTHLNEIERYLITELSAQIERDINMLVQAVQKAALQVNLSAQARGIPKKSALVEFIIGGARELQFFFHDRGNQKWPSRKFVRSVWRHALLSTYNEIVLMTLAEHKIDRATVANTDTKHTFHGLEIAISSNADMPTYDEIRNEIFHPNANAILMHVREA